MNAKKSAAMPPLLDPGNALFLDVDGTLLDSADRPDWVIVPPELPTVLASLCDHLHGAMALLSGRSLASLLCMFPGSPISLIGSYGAESTLWPQQRVRPLPEAVAIACTNAVSAWSGAVLEVKPSGVALHWRGNPAAQSSLQALARKLEQEWQMVRIDGRQVVELQTAPFSKHDAVVRAMTTPSFRHKLPVMVGDDRPDLAAMRYAHAAGGFSIYVNADDEQLGTYNVAEPAAIRDWLLACSNVRA